MLGSLAKCAAGKWVDEEWCIISVFRLWRYKRFVAFQNYKTPALTPWSILENHPKLQTHYTYSSQWTKYLEKSANSGKLIMSTDLKCELWTL